MKTFFVTWDGHMAGIKHGRPESLLVGDTRNTYTRLAVAEPLQDTNPLTNIALRSTFVRRSRYEEEGSAIASRIIPCSSDDSRALLLVSLMVRKRARPITWWSVRNAERKRLWMEPDGLSLNGRLLWQGIHQYGYGLRHDESRNAIVRRLLVVSEQNGFVVKDGHGWAFCIYWNGFTLEQTEREPLSYAQERINRFLTR